METLLSIRYSAKGASHIESEIETGVEAGNGQGMDGQKTIFVGKPGGDGSESKTKAGEDRHRKSHTA